MNAVASLPAVEPTLTRPRHVPTVLIDGYPEPRLQVQYATFQGPLDRRRVILTSAWNVPEVTEARWQRGRVVVALPHRLTDDQLRWSVLITGVLRRSEANQSAGQRARRFFVRDRWEERLDTPPSTIPWVSPANRLIAQPDGVFKLGRAANRSTQRFTISGQHAYVFQRFGEIWRVGDALETLSAVGGLDLALHALPRSIKAAALRTPLDLSRGIGDLLSDLLTDHGLIVQRSIERIGGQVRERRAVRPVSAGRAVSVRWPIENQPLSDVLRIDRAAPRAAAQPWIARAGGWVVESTFELVGGWDPALAGQADSEYGRTTSSDFSRYANVYRHWVLNEDGAFTGAPYNRGAPFDLTTFFDDRAVRPQPLSFHDCVTLDDAGDPLAPIVEISTDDGATWTRYSGTATLSTTRASVYLEDATLPSAFMTAAQNGQAKVRVTASLRSPRPVTARRWRGNPFAGRRPARVFDVSDGFRFQRVADASIHRGAIDAGSLPADEVDQTRSLQAWLVERLRRNETRLGEADGEASLTLAGAWAMVRPGDHLQQAGGAHQRLDRQEQAINQRGALVDAITVHFPIAHGQGPTTTMQLRF